MLTCSIRDRGPVNVCCNSKLHTEEKKAGDQKRFDSSHNIQKLLLIISVCLLTIVAIVMYIFIKFEVEIRKTKQR